MLTSKSVVLYAVEIFLKSNQEPVVGLLLWSNPDNTDDQRDAALELDIEVTWHRFTIMYLDAVGSHWVIPRRTQSSHCPLRGFTLSLSLWQMDQVRSELAQERAARQDLECDKTSLERQVLVLSPHTGLRPCSPSPLPALFMKTDFSFAFSQNKHFNITQNSRFFPTAEIYRKHCSVYWKLTVLTSFSVTYLKLL